MLLNIVIKPVPFCLFATKVVSLVDSSGKPNDGTQLILLFGQTAGNVNINFIYSRKKECLLEAGGIDRIICLLELVAPVMR
jgi:hypothetical protein